MKIAVIHDYADVFRTTRAYHRLRGHDVVVHTDAYTDPARVVEQVAGCEAVLLTQQRVPVTREIVARLPDLKFISQTSGNVYHVDLAACTEHGVVVSAGRGGGGGGRTPYSTTAELTWGLIIASLRHLPLEVERLKQGHWHTTAGTRLEGHTLGIYAFGHIGAAVARVGRAFGMKVVCWGREGSTARARAEGFEVAATREAFFEEADVVSLHLPGNRETRGIITADDLARMQPTALLVNTSRAPIIAEGALVAALHKGRPGFATVDVYEAEPVVGAQHPLLQMPNALCTPHLGYAERGSYEAPVHPGCRPVARLHRRGTHQRGESGSRWKAVAPSNAPALLDHDANRARKSIAQRQPHLKTVRAGLDRPEHRFVRVRDRERLAVDIPDDLRRAWFDDNLQRQAIERQRRLRVTPDAAVVFGCHDRQSDRDVTRRDVVDRIALVPRPGTMLGRDR